MRFKVKKTIMFVLLCSAIVLIYRFVFSYTIVSWGERYKHKISSVELFPFCYINPIYYESLKNSIKVFINNSFEDYYQKEYANDKTVRKFYFNNLNKLIKSDEYKLVSIRKTSQSNIIEILVLLNVENYTSVIFIFDTKTKKVIGFY